MISNSTTEKKLWAQSKSISRHSFSIQFYVCVYVGLCGFVCTCACILVISKGNSKGRELNGTIKYSHCDFEANTIVSFS